MNEALSAWVPSSVLAGILLAAFVYFFTKADRLLEKIVARLETLERVAHSFVTLEQMGRMGDRMDGRITNVTERVAVLEALNKK